MKDKEIENKKKREKQKKIVKDKEIEKKNIKRW